jgi:hypothetical protein
MCFRKTDDDIADDQLSRYFATLTASADFRDTIQRSTSFKRSIVNPLLSTFVVGNLQSRLDQHDLFLALSSVTTAMDGPTELILQIQGRSLEAGSCSGRSWAVMLHFCPL